MFVTGLIIGIIALGIVLTLYIDYLTESSLRSKLKVELPESTYAEVESINNQYDKEYGITYNLKVRQKDGASKKVEVKCKQSSLNRYSRISV